MVVCHLFKLSGQLFNLITTDLEPLISVLLDFFDADQIAAEVLRLRVQVIIHLLNLVAFQLVLLLHHDVLLQCQLQMGLFRLQTIDQSLLTLHTMDVLVQLLLGVLDH